MVEEALDRAISLIQRRLVLLPPQAQRPGGIAAGLAIRRFREGLTTMEQLITELLILGYNPDEVQRYQLQAILEYATDFYMDLFATYQQAFRNDLISEAQFRQALTELGMVPERIDGWVFRETIRKTPRPS